MSYFKAVFIHASDWLNLTFAVLLPPSPIDKLLSGILISHSWAFLYLHVLILLSFITTYILPVKTKKGFYNKCEKTITLKAIVF